MFGASGPQVCTTYGVGPFFSILLIAILLQGLTRMPSTSLVFFLLHWYTV